MATATGVQDVVKIHAYSDPITDNRDAVQLTISREDFENWEDLKARHLGDLQVGEYEAVVVDVNTGQAYWIRSHPRDASCRVAAQVEPV